MNCYACACVHRHRWAAAHAGAVLLQLPGLQGRDGGRVHARGVQLGRPVLLRLHDVAASAGGGGAAGAKDLRVRHGGLHGLDPGGGEDVQCDRQHEREAGLNRRDDVRWPPVAGEPAEGDHRLLLADVARAAAERHGSRGDHDYGRVDRSARVCEHRRELLDRRPERGATTQKVSVLLPPILQSAETGNSVLCARVCACCAE